MSVSADLNLTWVLQLIATVFLIALGLLHLLKNTASKYFVVDANFDSTAAAGHHRKMEVLDDGCIVCRSPSSKHCARCKTVKYCSETCQKSHWNSEHKLKCKDFSSSCKGKLVLAASTPGRRKTSVVSLVPASGSSKILNQSRKILFPYEEFVQLFNWDKPGFPPCGLLNCGNSCFANVVLQCLVYTKPLIAYILEKGHARECKRNDWCFFCEFERHVQTAHQSSQPFSPMNILSRLPSLGGNLGYGKQEDAHEFMRFAIDTMQLVCLDEFGGEKAVPPNSQETTLIQHIFGGRLQSQVICTQCNNISNQYENMMDLNVEIHGDVASLEECLDQFTAKESLHGDNMYKCDRCNDYVGAWKSLMICRAPNVLTIALKRFQRGRFGKLNKRVTFPETLDLRPYTSESKESDDVYKLYAVIVHVDMLNASFFGHYICYIKDFCGRWYRIDDCKVASVDLDEVLSQGAYMLLYSRISAQPTSLYPVENLKKEKQDVVKVEEVQPCLNKHVECATVESLDPPLETDKSLVTRTDIGKEEVYLQSNFDVSREEKVDSEASQSETKEIQENGKSFAAEETATSAEHAQSLVSSTQSVISEVDAEAGICQASSHADLLRNSTKDSQTNSYGNGEVQCDVSSHISNCGEILENGANSTVKHDKVKHSNGANGIQDGLNKSNGGREKLKPLFTPGFLGKRPRNKCVKPGAKVADEVSKLTLHGGPNGQSNGCLNNPNSESSHAAQHEEKPCIENTSSAIVNKQDGNGHLQSRESSSLCNEDLGLLHRS